MGGLTALMQPPGLSGFSVGYGVVAVLFTALSIAGRRRIGVSADTDGVVVRSVLSNQRVAWTQVRQQEPKDGAMDIAQSLALTDGRRLGLPSGIPPNLINDWRRQFHPGAEDPARDT